MEALCGGGSAFLLLVHMNDKPQSRPEPRFGPEFLSNLWDEHMRHEFATHNTEDTLATMVDDAYVNHIPVLTGGVGKDALREFYSKRFIPQMPPDTEVTPVSRTVGADQLVDELIGANSSRYRSYLGVGWHLRDEPLRIELAQRIFANASCQNGNVI